MNKEQKARVKELLGEGTKEDLAKSVVRWEGSASEFRGTIDRLRDENRKLSRREEDLKRAVKRLMGVVEEAWKLNDVLRRELAVAVLGAKGQYRQTIWNEVVNLVGEDHRGCASPNNLKWPSR